MEKYILSRGDYACEIKEYIQNQLKEDYYSKQ